MNIIDYLESSEFKNSVKKVHEYKADSVLDGSVLTNDDVRKWFKNHPLTQSYISDLKLDKILCPVKVHRLVMLILEDELR